MNDTHLHSTGSQVYDQILALLRSALWGEVRFPYHAPDQANWSEIYEELKQQTVQYLPVDLLAREDSQGSSKYIQLTAKNMIRWYRIMQEQQNICELFQDAHIPFVIVKGAAAACYYPQPSNRAMGDIDILVDPAYFERACEIISQSAESYGENFRHKEYKRNKLIIELHNRFGTFRDETKNDWFDQLVFHAISKAETTVIDSFSFPTLPKVENGLCLLSHIDIHLEGGLGLRQIIDWMMFVDRELDDRTWHNEFLPIIKKLDRETLAITVTRMCQMFLGLRTDITWCSHADESLCKELLDYIWGQGNFGRKSKDGMNSILSVISALKRPISFFRILQYRGCLNWALLARAPFMKPFAWLYQLWRYLYRGLASGNIFQKLTYAFAHSNAKSQFLERLGVSRMAEEGKKK